MYSYRRNTLQPIRVTSTFPVSITAMMESGLTPEAMCRRALEVTVTITAAGPGEKDEDAFLTA